MAVGSTKAVGRPSNERCKCFRKGQERFRHSCRPDCIERETATGLTGQGGLRAKALGKAHGGGVVREVPVQLEPGRCFRSIFCCSSFSCAEPPNNMVRWPPLGSMALSPVGQCFPPRCSQSVSFGVVSLKNAPRALASSRERGLSSFLAHDDGGGDSNLRIDAWGQSGPWKDAHMRTEAIASPTMEGV